MRTASHPLPISEIPAVLCRDLEWFFTDIDDTMTRDGMLPASSYSALWDLAGAGVRVVPVTGRPAGWCDHIARMWPVAGVIGENGAFSYSYDRDARRMKRRYSCPPDVLSGGRDRLRQIADMVLRSVPGSGIAADQAFRISDYAIDFKEDVPPLSEEKIEAICGILRREGVHAKVSSIHVNYWLGDFDKLTCLKSFLEEETGKPYSDAAEKMVFIGDSPNDEPLFGGVPHAIAVGNLRHFLHRITLMPRYITCADSADGLCEAVETILARREAGPRRPA